MRPVRWLAMTLAVSSLAAGCTGGPEVAPGVTPSAAPERPITYAAVGASETAGVGTEDPTLDAWPRVLWRTMPAGSVLYDFGVGGSTTRQALREQVGSAVAVGADVVTVWLNVNDLLQGVSVAEYGRHLRGVIRSLRAGGATTVLVANTPRLDTLPLYRACRSDGGTYVAPLGNVVACPPDAGLLTPPPTAVRSAVAAYNRAIERIVDEEGAVLVDLHALGDVPTDHPELVSEDGFHPSTEGAAAIAEAFERVLDAVV